MRRKLLLILRRTAAGLLPGVVLLGALVLLAWLVLTRGLALLSGLLVRLTTLLAGILPPWFCCWPP